MGWAGPDKWARLSPRKRLGQHRPRIFFLLFLGGVGPDQPIRLSHNWLGSMPCLIICRNVNNYCSRSACNRTVAEAVDGRRRRLPGSVVTAVIRRLSWWSGRLRCEERWKSWWPVAEEAKEEEENGRGCREERERFTVTLGGRLMASYGGADGGKPSDEGGGGWRPQRRETEEKGPVAGKLSREGWFLAEFGPEFLLPQVINGASIYRRWKRVILST